MEGINTNAVINSKIIDHLLKFGKEKYFNEGEFVFNEGDESDYVYIILEGEIDVLVRDARDSMRIINKLGNGAIFGEMGIFLKNRRSASIRAIKNLKVVYFTAKEFINAISKLPAFNVNVMNILAGRLYESNKKVVNLNNYKSYLSVLMELYFSIDTKNEGRLKSSTSCSKLNIKTSDLMKVLLELDRDGVIFDLNVDNPEDINFKINKNKIQSYIQDIAFSPV